jgi:membrane-bound metal-dependent hydrolase YbcI (DUF457 family)
MPDREVHFTISFIALIILIYFNFPINYAFALIIGSILPDIFEPAYHYTHRGFFHSKRMLKYTFLTVIALPIGFLLSWINLSSGLFLFIGYLALGYILHLLADSTTPMGLPK